MDIARALRELILYPELRSELAQASYERAQLYSWNRCADQTLDFLSTVAHQKNIHIKRVGASDN